MIGCFKSLLSRPTGSLQLDTGLWKRALCSKTDDVYDIVIVGGGMVGAAVGALLGDADFDSA
jgi:hypothetical protein